MNRELKTFCGRIRFTTPSKGNPKDYGIEAVTTATILVKAFTFPGAVDEIRENLTRLHESDDCLKDAGLVYLTNLLVLDEVPKKGILLFLENQESPVYHHVSTFSAFRNVDGLKVGHFRFTEESTDGTEPKLSDMPLVDFATDASEFNNDGEHPANARYSMQVVAEEVSDPAKWDINYRLRPGEKAPAR